MNQLVTIRKYEISVRDITIELIKGFWLHIMTMYNPQRKLSMI